MGEACTTGVLLTFLKHLQVAPGIIKACRHANLGQNPNERYLYYGASSMLRGGAVELPNRSDVSV